MIKQARPASWLFSGDRLIPEISPHAQQPIRLGDDDDSYIGSNKADRVYGEGGDDFIHGGGGDDVIKGESGNDSLSGDTGSDYLIGGSGDDELFGDKGRDVLYGGQGSDRIDFHTDSSQDIALYKKFSDSPLGSGHDTIAGFDSCHDRVDLTAIDANTLTPADDRFHWIGSDAFSGKPGELRYDPDIDVSLLQGDVNGDGVADFEIYFLTFAPLDLTARNFEL